MRTRVGVLGVIVLASVGSVLRSDLLATAGQTLDPGRAAFEGRCARCHGADGNGGEMGPPIAQRITPLDDEQLAKTIRDGLPAKGMPPNVIADPELAALMKFLRTIQRRPSPVVRATVRTTDGRALEGQVLGEGFDDLQLRTDDTRVHLLRRVQDRFRVGTLEAG
jgi:mono/diheme cytochrome c family protein